MVFKRRDKPPLLTRIRAALLPRRGYRRGIEYLGHRVRRLPDTPHRIALGLSCGVFSSFTPFFGLHFIFALAVARAVRGNMIAALIGTGVGNPADLSLHRAVALGLGRRILGLRRERARLRAGLRCIRPGLRGDQARGPQPLRLWRERMVQAGAVLSRHGLALPCRRAAARAGRRRWSSYYLTRPLVAAYQTRRRSRMLARAHERLARQKVEIDLRPAASRRNRKRDHAMPP